MLNLTISSNHRLLFAGRGKKKQLKHLLPLLLAAKAKIGALATLGYFVTGFIAKKAIVVSLIDLARHLRLHRFQITLVQGWSRCHPLPRLEQWSVSLLRRMVRPSFLWWMVVWWFLG